MTSNELNKPPKHYTNWKQKCIDLESELRLLKAQTTGDCHDDTILYLLRTGESLIQAASALVAMRLSKSAEQTKPAKSD